MQLYGYGVGPPECRKTKQQYPPRLWERLERLKVADMKRIAKTQRAPTDDLYYVSAADIADKLIDRMRGVWILSSLPAPHWLFSQRVQCRGLMRVESLINA